MAQQNCGKCFKRFRSSKQKEPVCAKCAMDNLPDVEEEDVAQMEAEFNEFAVQIYGTTDLLATPSVLHVDNIFNHKTRLEILKEKNEKKANQSTKERQKFSREVNRLSEENNAIRDRLKSMKNNLMSAVMLAFTTKPVKVGSETKKPESVQEAPRVSNFSIAKELVANIRSVGVLSPEKEDSPKKTVSPAEASKSPEDDALTPLIRSNSVRNRVLELQNKVSHKVVDPIRSPEATNNNNHSPIRGSVVKDSADNGISVHITCRVADTPPRSDGFKVPFPVEKKVIIPKMEEVAEPDQISDSGEDELTPLKRSNSVRNRIQAFEALSRRASTGTWDRGASPRRKLNF